MGIHKPVLKTTLNVQFHKCATHRVISGVRWCSKSSTVVTYSFCRVLFGVFNSSPDGDWSITSLMFGNVVLEVPLYISLSSSGVEKQIKWAVHNAMILSSTAGIKLLSESLETRPLSPDARWNEPVANSLRVDRTRTLRCLKRLLLMQTCSPHQCTHSTATTILYSSWCHFNEWYTA